MNYITIYKNKLNELKESLIGVNIDKIQNYGLLGTYKLVSANLSHFLPTIPKKKHLEIIKEIHFNRLQAVIDQEFLFLLDNLTIDDNLGLIDNCKYKSYIISTYHTGSYRLLIALLSKLNIKFCLVTEQNFIETQGNIVKQLFRKVKEGLTQDSLTEDLEILNAENPFLFRQLIKKINSNYSIVFYVDGNTGTNKSTESLENLLKINFLSSYIYARKGIAFLSHLTKTPIISVISNRNGITHNHLKVDLIPFNDFSEIREEYIKRSTKLMYLNLENFVKTKPEQWEGWFYIHKFFVRERTEITESFSVESINELKQKKINTIKFNTKQYESIVFNHNLFFLIDFRNYKVLKITSELNTVLHNFMKPKKIRYQKEYSISNIKLEQSALLELLQLNVLVAE